MEPQQHLTSLGLARALTFAADSGAVHAFCSGSWNNEQSTRIAQHELLFLSCSFRKESIKSQPPAPSDVLGNVTTSTNVNMAQLHHHERVVVQFMATTFSSGHSTPLQRPCSRRA